MKSFFSHGLAGGWCPGATGGASPEITAGKPFRLFPPATTNAVQENVLRGKGSYCSPPPPPPAFPSYTTQFEERKQQNPRRRRKETGAKRGWGLFLYELRHFPSPSSYRVQDGRRLLVLVCRQPLFFHGKEPRFFFPSLQGGGWERRRRAILPPICQAVSLGLITFECQCISMRER